MVMIAFSLGVIMVIASVIVIMYMARLAVYRFGDEGDHPQKDDHDDRDPAPKDIPVECILEDVLKQVAVPEHDGDYAEQTADRERKNLLQVIR